jgi:hypothetical protein
MSHKNPLTVFGLSDNRHGKPSKKVLARRWMFDLYREASGNIRLPRHLQYWTLAGQMVYEMDPRRLQPMCEAWQAVEEGLIHPTQYVGVEQRARFHAANIQQQDLPLALEYGRIDEVMFDYVDRREFRPGIINLDSTHGPDRAVALLAGVNRVLRHCEADDQPLVLFLNIQLGNIWSGIHHDRDHQVVKAIQGSLEVSSMLLREGWKLLRETGQYDGTGSLSRSAMRIYCFTRGLEVKARRVA